MARSRLFLSLLIVTGLMVGMFTGCSTVGKMPAMELKQPDNRVVDQIIFLADTSSSMSQSQDLLAERDLLHATFLGMPEGNYEAGLMAFNTETLVLVPHQPFNRGALIQETDSLLNMAGSTFLPYALHAVQQDIEQTNKRVALVILSDGKHIDPPAAYFAAKRLVEAHQGTMCIHTILFGSDTKGAATLTRLSQLTDCGSFRFAASLKSREGLKSFIQTLFFGKQQDTAQEEVEETTPSQEKKKDSDGDGVADADDQCPNTPKGASVDARGCWVIPNLEFDYDKAAIRSEYHDDLNQVASVLKKNPKLNIRIDGHTDSIGSKQFNQQLSLRRANAVMNYLEQQGISADRLTVKGWGFSQPIKPNDSAENRQENRRVEITPKN
ncbi:OmpA family protein [bacterium]|nr:OmpA family protein [bacterium]